MTTTTLTDRLRRSFAEFADRVLLHERGADRTYAEVDAAAAALSEHLTNAGVAPGDRVGVLLANSFEYVAAWWGALRLGAIAVPLNPETTRHELRLTLGSCRPTAVVCTHKTAGPVRDLPEIAETLRTLVVVGEPLAEVPGTTRWNAIANRAPQANLVLPCPATADDPAQIIFTSGTTGKPKGVVLTQGNLASNTAAIVEMLGLTRADAAFVTLPFFYSYGNSVLLTHLAVGGRLILASDFVFWNRALDLMERTRATGYAGVPSSFAMLLAKSDFARRSFPDLRYLTCAGGALSAARVAELQAAHPQAELFLMYGQTEATARLSILSPADLADRPGSIGKGLPGMRLEVLDEAGRPVPPGETGEITACGPNVMAGYWNDPYATAEVVRDGRLHTGDLARVDEDGFIYIVGRRSDLLKCGAYRIHPLEIEEVLAAIPGIAEAAVAGLPDEIQGQIPVAFVVRRPDADDLTEETVLAACREGLPRHKQPRQVRFVDSLPKTSTGKIQRQRLTETAASVA